MVRSAVSALYHHTVYYLIEWDEEDSVSAVSEKSIPKGIVAEIGATVPVKVGKTTFTGKVVSSGWSPTVQVKLWLLHMHLTGSKTEMDLRVDADSCKEVTSDANVQQKRKRQTKSM